MEKHGLDASTGGGAHMWREVWNEEVSKVYKEVLSMLPSSFCYDAADTLEDVEEPIFGRPRKADPYAEVKRIKRYV